MREKLATFAERNTLVVYVSDNGYLWGEHNLEGKDEPYVQSTKVPLMMRWPNHTQPGVGDERFALNIDIAPTILEAAGIVRGHHVGPASSVPGMPEGVNHRGTRVAVGAAR